MLENHGSNPDSNTKDTEPELLRYEGGEQTVMRILDRVCQAKPCCREPERKEDHRDSGMSSCVYVYVCGGGRRMLQVENRTKPRKATGDRCLGGGLLGGGREHVAALLLEEHDVESVKVRERAAGLDGSALLGPSGLSPLVGDTSLLEELLDDGRTSTAGETGDGELGQGEVLESERLTGNTRGGRVNDGLRNRKVSGKSGRKSQLSVTRHAVVNTATSNDLA